MNPNTNLAELLNLPQGQLDPADAKDHIPDYDTGVPLINAEIVRRILLASNEE